MILKHEHEDLNLFLFLKNEIYYKILDKKLSSEEILVLDHVLLSLNRKIQSCLKSSFLVLDIKDFIGSTLSTINEFQTNSLSLLRSASFDKYTKSLDQKIQNANQVLKYLQKDTNKYSNLLIENIGNILKKVNRKKEETSLNANILSVKKENLIEYLKEKKYFDCVKIFTDVLSAFGSKAEIIAKIIQFGSDRLQDHILSKDEISSNSEFVDEYKNLKSNSFVNDHEKAHQFESVMDDQEEDKKEINKLINQNSDYFGLLNIVEERLIRINDNLLRNDSFLKNSNLTESKTRLQFIMNKLKYSKNLNLLSFELSELTKNIDLSKSLEISNTLKRVEYSISTMKDVFDSIQESINQIEFATYMKEITENPNYAENFIKNSDNKEKIEIFKNITNYEIIKENHHRALEAFRLWSFPFFANIWRIFI